MLEETALRIVDGLLCLEQGPVPLEEEAEGGSSSFRRSDPLKHPNVDAVLKAARFALWDQPKLVDSAVDLLDSIKANDTTIRCYISVSSSNAVPGGGGGGGPSFVLRRKCWRVPGSDKGTEYTCLTHYCPCPTYTEMAKCVQEGRTAVCKHLVAIRIATALSLVTNSVLSEEQYVAKMCEPPSVSTNATNRMLRW